MVQMITHLNPFDQKHRTITKWHSSFFDMMFSHCMLTVLVKIVFRYKCVDVIHFESSIKFGEPFAWGPSNSWYTCLVSFKSGIWYNRLQQHGKDIWQTTLGGYWPHSPNTMTFEVVAFKFNTQRVHLRKETINFFQSRFTEAPHITAVYRVKGAKRPSHWWCFDRIRNSIEFYNALVYNIFGRSQRNFAHVTTVMRCHEVCKISS